MIGAAAVLALGLRPAGRQASRRGLRSALAALRDAIPPWPAPGAACMIPTEIES